MKKKIIYFLTFILLICLTTGCMSKENDTTETNNSDANVAKEYTELEIIGATARFKKQDPTNYWDCEDNFGAGEIDTVYIPSEGGKEVPNYYDQENTSGIIFQTSDDVVSSESYIKTIYKRWDNIDVKVENINKGIFKKHITGESSELYYESYSFSYEGEYDGEKFDVYYKIELRIYKNDYTKEEQSKLISEYNTIIDTFEIK